ncbi:hypothetical protein ACFSQ7_41765 [Paenibacillus rhizoplanae]
MGRNDKRSDEYGDTVRLFAWRCDYHLSGQKNEKSASLLIIIRSLVFFSLAQVFFMNLFSVGELDYLFGMLSSAAAYYLLLTGVYRLTIEEPFQESQQAEARINYLAYHDELTGLPNRRRLMQRMEEVVFQSEQDKKPRLLRAGHYEHQPFQEYQ